MAEAQRLAAVPPLSAALRVFGWEPVFSVVAVVTAGMIPVVWVGVRDAPGGAVHTAQDAPRESPRTPQDAPGESRLRPGHRQGRKLLFRSLRRRARRVS